jgi:hypothetical protein
VARMGEKCAMGFGGEAWGEGPLGDLGVDGEIILKRTLK